VGFVLLNQKFLLVKNDIDVNGHERLFNITLRHKFKKRHRAVLHFSHNIVLWIIVFLFVLSIYDLGSGSSQYHTGNNSSDIERHINLKTWITWRFHDVVYISYEIVPEYFVKLNHPSSPWQHVVEEHLAVVFPEKQNRNSLYFQIIQSQVIQLHIMFFKFPK
jgi:hypothetical protein